MSCPTNFFKIQLELRVIYRSIEEKPVGKSTRNFKAAKSMQGMYVNLALKGMHKIKPKWNGHETIQRPLSAWVGCIQGGQLKRCIRKN